MTATTTTITTGRPVRAAGVFACAQIVSGLRPATMPSLEGKDVERSWHNTQLDSSYAPKQSHNPVGAALT